MEWQRIWACVRYHKCFHKQDVNIFYRLLEKNATHVQPTWENIWVFVFPTEDLLFLLYLRDDVAYFVQTCEICNRVIEKLWKAYPTGQPLWKSDLPWRTLAATDWGRVPDHLEPLNALEQCAVARVHIFGMIYKLRNPRRFGDSCLKVSVFHE